MGNSKSSIRNQVDTLSYIKTPTEQTIKTSKSAENKETEASTLKSTKNSSIQPTLRDRNVPSEGEFDAPTATVTPKPKTPEDKTLIQKALSHHFLFSHLPQENVDRIIEEMQFYSLRSKEIIFRQGDPGNSFFVLSKGRVEIIINGASKGFITEGNSFGELALIHDSRRTATIRTTEKVNMWGIGRKVFRDALKTLSSLKFEENRKFIRSVPFLKMLTESQTDSLAAGAVSQDFEHGQQIVVEGDPGDLFYIIQEGSVQCSSEGEMKRVLNTGDYFGEQALLYNTLRTATVTAIRKVKVLCLGREMLVTVLGEKLQFALYKNTMRIAFDKSKCLRRLSKAQIEQSIEKMQIFSYQNGEIVVPQGTVKNRYLWIVLKGAIHSQSEKFSVFQNLGAEWIYNEDSGLVENNHYASGDVDIGMIRKDTLEKIIDGKLSEVSAQNEIVEILKKVQLFRTLAEGRLRLLSKYVKTKEFQENEEIFAQGDKGDCFYVVKTGEVFVIKEGNVVRTVGKGNFFGERSIIMNENRTASVVCKCKSELYMLSRADFMDIVDEYMLALLVKRIKLQDDTIELSDLAILEKLGKGTYGSVYLCENKNNKELYALKTVPRMKIELHKLQESLSLERKVLLSIDHQFIVKLVKTFKDSKRIYFLQEYVQGLCLFKVLRVLNLLNSQTCRFYSACLVCILEHLHENQIIYRDLKPENIMVDDCGYLKLLDFGTAKFVKERTFSVVGTPHYMAPEVILGKGYDKKADLWSLGVMIFEFVCGKVPFGEDTHNEPFSIYKEIISGKIVYPKFIKETCREKPIIELLLNKVPNMRGSATRLKEHKLFADIEWETLLSKKYKPPFLPTGQFSYRQESNKIGLGKTIEEILTEQEVPEIVKNKKKRKIVPTDWDLDF